MNVTYLGNGENLGKFDSKSDLGIFRRYSNKSKASRVYNQNSQEYRQKVESVRVPKNCPAEYIKTLKSV